jgi:predicted ATP-dependent serine protease
MDATKGGLPRASTGIAGLDEILGGGWARTRMHLLEGSPGAPVRRRLLCNSCLPEQSAASAGRT